MATLASRAAGSLPLADSPLGRTIATTATDIWNDSCAVDELMRALWRRRRDREPVSSPTSGRATRLMARPCPGAGRRTPNATEVDLA
jgi:hypothetical protein